MEYIISFVVAVMARIVGYCICKWLDSHKSGKQPEKNPPRVAALGGFAYVSIWKHLITFVVYIIYYESTFVKRLIKNLRVAALRFFHFFMCGNMNIISFVVTYIIYHRFIFVKGLKKYSLFLTKMKSPECQLWGFRSCETHELLFYHLWLFILYTTNLFLSRGK